MVRHFRPLRGLRVSQCPHTAVDVDGVKRFPSPAGSSCFSIGKNEANKKAPSYFRPLRGLRVSQCYFCSLAQSGERISVPCGVFVFLNTEERVLRYALNHFRPLRGLRVSQ